MSQNLHGLSSGHKSQEVDYGTGYHVKQPNEQVVNPEVSIQPERVVPQNHGARYLLTLDLVQVHEPSPVDGFLTGRYRIVDHRVLRFIQIIILLLLLDLP